MIKFHVNKELCISCGQCAADCLVHIIELKDGKPLVDRREGLKCIGCQHCLAICPVGAISVQGVKPEECLSLEGGFPEEDKLERLIKGRRSVRRYQQEGLDPALIRRLLDVASYAPTGKNVRRVRFTVIDTRAVMDKFRTEALDLLARRVRSGQLPVRAEAFTEHSRLWEEKKIDTIFRGAPHLVIASAPKDCPAPDADCLIALSYFELLSQAQGVGTVWAGMAKWLITLVVPELRARLGIPEDHVVGYVMAFGKPLGAYARTVKRTPFETVNVSL